MKVNMYLCAIALFSIALFSCTSVKAEAPTVKQEEPADVSHLQGKVPFLTMHSQNLRKAQSPISPFINTSLPLPPKNEYSGRLFQLRHDYPKTLPAPPPAGFPWKKVTNNGKITTDNAQKYVEALKKYVSKDIRKFIFDYENWKPNEENWWQSIWLGTEREPIRGVYVGSTYPPGTLTGQTLSLTTYVFTMYDGRAAKTLGDIWGTTLDRAMNPVFKKETTQYKEGSIIVKFAFVTSCGSDWPPMAGAAKCQIYAPLNISNGSGHSHTSKCNDNRTVGNSVTPQLTNVYLMQFDIIVKDSVAAPDTGWVFSTLIYDKDAPGKDAWDKMIPLGATWGGNPDVINTKSSALTPPVKVSHKLTENWINLNTPKYSRSTLGWDGRLSGPNDGAVVTPAWAGTHYFPKGLASAGCIGCHSSAQYPMTSFLLPATSYPPATLSPPLSSDPNAAALVLPKPGSKLWMKWFQSRNGYTPMGPPSSIGTPPVALDYDMVTAFKAIPMWEAAIEAQKK